MFCVQRKKTMNLKTHIYLTGPIISSHSRDLVSKSNFQFCFTEPISILFHRTNISCNNKESKRESELDILGQTKSHSRTTQIEENEGV